MAPHPEQVPTLRDRLTDKSTQLDNDMIVNEPASVAAEPNPWPLTPVNNMETLPYNNEDEIEFSV